VATEIPTSSPSLIPTDVPTIDPSAETTSLPSEFPTSSPTSAPSAVPTYSATNSVEPTYTPSAQPSVTITSISLVTDYMENVIVSSTYAYYYSNVLRSFLFTARASTNLLTSPCGIVAGTSDYTYFVTDSYSNQVFQFYYGYSTDSSSSLYLNPITSTSFFSSPSFIDVDNDDNVYVVDDNGLSVTEYPYIDEPNQILLGSLTGLTVNKS